MDPGKYDRLYRDDVEDVFDAHRHDFREDLEGVIAWRLAQEGDAGSVGACDLCGEVTEHTHTHCEYGFPVNVEEEESGCSAQLR